jgi:hypothetical protein
MKKQQRAMESGQSAITAMYAALDLTIGVGVVKYLFL